MLDLRSVSDANKAPRADINIEIAHTYWEGEDFAARFREEYAKSVKLLSNLGLSTDQTRIVISVLLDDKRMSSPDRMAWFRSQAVECEKEFQNIDYVVFESDLKSLLSVLYPKIAPARKNAIQSDIERYVRTKKKAACSHDISVWHTMRSGALGYKKLPIYTVVGRNSDKTRLLPSFCAPRLVSILNKSDRDHEEDAETDILRHVRSNRFDWRGIERNYYY